MFSFCLLGLNKSKTKGKESHRNSLPEKMPMTSADPGFDPKGSIFLPHPIRTLKIKTGTGREGKTCCINE